MYRERRPFVLFYVSAPYLFQIPFRPSSLPCILYDAPVLSLYYVKVKFLIMYDTGFFCICILGAKGR